MLYDAGADGCGAVLAVCAGISALQFGTYPTLCLCVVVGARYQLPGSTLDPQQARYSGF